MPIERYSPAEERANALTHGAGALLAGIGTVFLIANAQGTGSLAAILVYGAALIGLFLFSSLHHAVRRPRLKQALLAFDHCGIFLLIAGTYTPFSLLLAPDRQGALLALIWGLAALGILVQMAAFLAGRADGYERLAFLFYLAMGWIPILSSGRPVFDVLAPGGLMLLVAGGLAYSLGIVFYLRKSLRFGHAVWHLFVVAGSALHFFAILIYVMPNAAAGRPNQSVSAAMSAAKEGQPSISSARLP